jgi:cytochrome c biogenesis protein CcdA/thiol-disulfide isomerase/thioredoxin
MLLILLAFLGGALTIISPCILPVLPFVFARQGTSFARSTLPLLVGMTVTFAAIATLAAVGGAWALRVNTWARGLALAFLVVFAAALLSKRVAEWLSRPFVALGNRALAAGGEGGGMLPSLTLGAATGLLWAPCAGPILGLVLTGAALGGPSAHTTLLLLAYGLGAAVSLALATLVGGQILRAMKLSLASTEWLRRGLGVAVLVSVVAIVAGWDTGLLTRLSFASTNRVEQTLIDTLRTEGRGATPAMTMQGRGMAGRTEASGPGIEGEMPPLTGATSWLNSEALTPEALRGKVVLIDFWTYSCINCLRTLPHLRAWQERYRNYPFTVVGVHTPEFAFEKDKQNVERAVRDLGITYPVAIDDKYGIWRAFGNEYWPAHYFIDSQGRIRGHHFGEGGYDESESLIRELLTEAGASNLPAPIGPLNGRGIELAANENEVASPETYIGYERAERFVSSERPPTDSARNYSFPKQFLLNDWALQGRWKVGPESAVLLAPRGKISFRFHARDLHLVLGAGPDGKPQRFRVTLDGRAPGADSGVDINTNGEGVIREQRLYQLIRQSGHVIDRTFTIEFLDPGVQAWSFTFG